MFATYPEKSPVTNLRYAMNRWYSSQIGRFTTPDPYQASASLANPQSWNRYAYVENDPVNFNDPSGLNRAAPYCYWYNDNIGSEGGGFYFLREYWSYLVCEDWGGGGGRFSPPEETGVGASEPTPVGTLTEAYRPKLAEAIQNLSELCKDRLPVAELLSGVGELKFFDGSRRTGDGAFRASDLFPGASSKTLYALSAGRGGWVVRSAEGKISDLVVLTATFMNVLDPGQRSATLVHEALHAITKRDDAYLGGIAYQYGVEPTGSPDRDFQRWVENGCPGERRE